MSTSLRDLARRVDALPTTHFDATDLMRQGKARLRRRRRAAVAGTAVAVGLIVVGAALLIAPDSRDAAPPARSSHWVLVTGSGVGGADNPVQPVGDEWAEPLADRGVQSYPNFRSADPATQRFLVQNMEGTAWLVMTLGQREPLATIYADFGAALGPGPDEVTTISSDLQRMVVLGPDGLIRRSFSAGWTSTPPNGGFSGAFAWSPDGETLAETRLEHVPDKGSLTVVLRDPDSPEVTTLYEYSEAAPPWYDAEEHRFGNGPGAFNDWSAPRLVDLRWAPDSHPTGLRHDDHARGQARRPAHPVAVVRSRHRHRRGRPDRGPGAVYRTCRRERPARRRLRAEVPVPGLDTRRREPDRAVGLNPDSLRPDREGAGLQAHNDPRTLGVAGVEVKPDARPETGYRSARESPSRQTPS